MRTIRIISFSGHRSADGGSALDDRHEVREAANGGLFWFVRRRSSTAGDDTAAQALVIALIGAVATFGASRLYQRSALLLIVALVVAFIIGALVVRMARVKPAQQRS
jgi:hypothetical protein